MSRCRSRIVPLLLALALAGCQKTGGGAGADDATKKRLDELEKKVTAIDGRLAKIERFLEEVTGQPKQPDPAAVYSVPVNAVDPIRGPQVAKITIIEGFEFA